MTVLFSLNAFADNPDHYPKLNDLIDTVANKDYDRITRETIETLNKAKREEDVNSFKKML